MCLSVYQNVIYYDSLEFWLKIEILSLVLVVRHEIGSMLICIKLPGRFLQTLKFINTSLSISDTGLRIGRQILGILFHFVTPLHLSVEASVPNTQSAMSLWAKECKDCVYSLNALVLVLEGS